jgi:hypothetical protein
LVSTAPLTIQTGSPLPEKHSSTDRASPSMAMGPVFSSVSSASSVASGLLKLVPPSTFFRVFAVSTMTLPPSRWMASTWPPVSLRRRMRRVAGSK